MAMVISPRSKIVTLALLIGIITLVALIITGVIGFWHKTEKPPNNGTKMVSSRLQQFTGYTATKHDEVFGGTPRVCASQHRESSVSSLFVAMNLIAKA
uniref:Uncharacterized protein n=1 Tax=Vespula pensylvanica TaxID=30213 RepID=A0A834PFN2_VESPE|nr:hypothetical protein H0235_001195 [Vespula pensylvanica]